MQEDPTIYRRKSEHPYRADSVAELSDELQYFVLHSLPTNDPIVTIIVIPPHTVSKKLAGLRGVSSLPEQALLFTVNGLLHVQGAKLLNYPGRATYMCGRDFLYGQLSIILLYGQLELYGVSDNTMTSIVVEFNTVGYELIKPGINHLRSLACGSSHTLTPNSKFTDRLLNDLEQKSLKFRNALAHYALRKNENLLGCVFQPRILDTYFKIFRKFVAPGSLLALTKDELILVEEGRTKATSYGLFFTFCPRSCIMHIAIQPKEGWNDFHVYLQKEDVSADHRITMDNDTVQVWQALWKAQAN